jgi:AraC-like DNA-binding protein
MEGVQRRFAISSAETTNVARKWREFLCELYYPIEAYEINKTNFQGRLDETRLDFLQITTFEADHQRVERTRFHTKFDTSEEFVLIIPRKGTTRWGQFGRDSSFGAFSSTMVLSSEPYWAACSNDFANVTIRIPAELLRSRVKDCEALCGIPMRHSAVLNRALWDLLSGFFAAGAEAPDEFLSRRLAETVVDLIVFALARERGHGDLDARGQKDLIRDRIIGYVKSHLSDPLLSPLSVAQANGISVSYMNKLLRASGKSMSRRLLDERLAFCRARLTEANFRHLPIGRIAFDAGFSNQSYFTSCFRAKYGMTPRELRSAALPRSGSGKISERG